MDWTKELIERAKTDILYQQMLAEVKTREIEFLNICQALSREQKQIIDDYIAACEELDHILAGIAYTLGRE